MTKQELFERVAEECGVSKVKAKEIVNCVLSTIQAEVAADRPVILQGFGKFHAHQRRARQGRNPATGESVAVPAKVVPKFKPGNSFREYVNS